MRIVYRFVEDFTSSDVLFLAKLGIKVQQGFDALLIDKDAPQLKAIKEHFKASWDDTVAAEMVFEKRELKSAGFLQVYAEKYLGYAMPDIDGDVFEIAGTDEDYGVLRGRQTGLFKMKAEPKWGKWKMASLHFAEHIFFVSPDTYESVFKPFNIGFKPVLDLKTKMPLKTIVQLEQQGIAQSKLMITDGYVDETETVNAWKLTKYVLRMDRPFPLFENDPGNLDFFYTQEYFGSGGHTQRGTIISDKLYRVLLDNKMTGLNYCPLMEIVE